MVGMSSAHEVIVAQHCEMRIFGLSLVTNVGNADYESTDIPNHDEVLKAAKDMEEPLKVFVSKIVEYMGDLSNCSPNTNIINAAPESAVCAGKCSY